MVQARAVADDSPAGYFISYYIGDEYQTQCDNNVSTQVYY